MRLFGFEITRAKVGELVAKDYNAIPSYGTGWIGRILEPFSGAWQQGIAIESPRNLLAFSAVYACVSLIANDIAKLRIKLTERQTSGVWTEVDSSPFIGVLAKPNRYQTRVQFLSQWMTTKLLHGNVYALKERDARGMVRALYLLDCERVTPLITEDGEVYYRLKGYQLAGVDKEGIEVPASEIIHDRMVTLWHPLIGVTPIYACGASATQGMRIQANSARFFENMSRPSGVMTAPGKISNETALRLKDEFEKNFSGTNIGRILVGGDGLKYEPISMAASDAQLIEQQRWTVEDVARCFHVPLHKIQAGTDPSHTNIAALNQDYYSQTLQSHIEAIEILLDEGLALPTSYGTELDLDALLRMDPSARYDANSKGVGGGWLAPNEARAGENLPPVEGGDTPYLQQQNYSLAALNKRPPPSDKPAPTAQADSVPNPPPAVDSAKSLADALIRKFTEAAHA